jgi:hypothetical protein
MGGMTKAVGTAAILALTGAQGAAAQEIKKLSAADLGVETRKWEGRKIETQLRCFYADKDEYRCIGGKARVDLSKISNPDGKSYLEDKCDTIERMVGNACLVTVRFVYSGYRKEETDGGNKLTMVEAEDDTGEVIPPAARKRR